MNTDACM